MNVKAIKELVGMAESDEQIEWGIISILSEDKEVIPTLLGILEEERQTQKQLLQDTNLELSRALITLIDPNLGKKKPKPYIELSFVVGEIMKHYKKWEDTIRCCFKIKGLK